jgi:hypothetical protein
LSLPFVTYDQLETCGIDFSQVFFACKAFDKKRNFKQPIQSPDSIYQWKTQGIPGRFRFIVSKIVSDFSRRVADKAAVVAARAPQIDLFKSADDLTRNVFLSNENNELDANLSGFLPPPLANNRKSAVSLEPQGLQGFDSDDWAADFILSIYAVVSSALIAHIEEQDKVYNALAFLEITCFSLVFETIEKHDDAFSIVDIVDDFYFLFANFFRNPSAKFSQRLLPKEHIILTAIRDVIAQDIEKNESKYHRNLDALAYSAVSDTEAKKNPYLEYYYLSSIVRRIEGQVKIDTFKQIRKQGGVIPPKEHSLAAYNCGRRVMPDALQDKVYGDKKPIGAVDVINTNGKFSYHGLMVCKDVWGCPTCARKITERRQNGLGLLLNSHVEKWGQCSISASLFTIPHGLGNDLDDILDRLHGAWRYMTMTNAYKDLMKRFGMRGSVRALECTYGKNGFHPHFHVLHFFDHDIKKQNSEGDAGIDFLKDSLFALWTKALIRYDFNPPDTRAFGCVAIATDKRSLEDVAKYFGKMEDEVGDSDINAYLKKHKDKGVRSVDVNGKIVTHHWGEEAEMTKWHIKKGGNYHYSMFDFLRGFAVSELQGDKQNQGIFKELWLTYRHGFKRKQQLVTRHMDFKIPELVASDAEVADLETKEEKSIALSVTFDQWVSVLRCNARASLLRVLQVGHDPVAFFDSLSTRLQREDKAVTSPEVNQNYLKILIFLDSIGITYNFLANLLRFPAPKSQWDDGFKYTGLSPAQKSKIKTYLISQNIEFDYSIFV